MCERALYQIKAQPGRVFSVKNFHFKINAGRTASKCRKFKLMAEGCKVVKFRETSKIVNSYFILKCFLRLNKM